MNFTFQALPARFISRPNRFVVVAKLVQSGKEVRAHCADPGRMRDLLIPGTEIYLSRSSTTNRKTAYDLRFVNHPLTGQLVSVDSQLPNRLFADAMREGTIAPLSDYQLVRNEVTMPVVDTGVRQTKSRIDFLLADEKSNDFWVEVKSVTLVENRIAWFPEAPTERGRRHVLELMNLRQRHGVRAAIVFLVQRSDADEVRPNRVIDPAFADALCHAAENGVEIYAYRCKLSLESISVDRRIEVVVSAPD